MQGVPKLVYKFGIEVEHTITNFPIVNQSINSFIQSKILSPQPEPGFFLITLKVIKTF